MMERVGYTVREVAMWLGVSEWTVYMWIKFRRLKAVKIGRRWYISQDELERITKEGLDVKGLRRLIKGEGKHGEH